MRCGRLFGAELLALAALSGCQQTSPPAAALEALFSGGSYRFDVHATGGGYPLRIACTRGCANAVERTESLADHPLGLIARDKDDLVFYLSSSGSAYQFRAWQLTSTGAEQVADFSSRKVPLVINGPQGETKVQITEAIKPGDMRTIDWTWRDGRFVRLPG